MDHDAEPTAAADQAAEPRTARGVAVAFASLLIPGAGQLVVGAWRRGLVMLAFTVLLLAGVWGDGSASRIALEALTQPGGLAGLLLGNVALGVLRVYATLDAFRLGSGGPGTTTGDQALTRGSLVAVAALAALAVAPHALATHYTLVANEMLGSVFAAPDDAEGSSGVDTGIATGPQERSQEAVSQEPSSSDGEQRLASLHDDDRLTVAVLGSDAAPSRPGHRVDAMMVVSVDPETGHATAFSVDRHLRDFPLPDGLETAWHARCRDAAPGWDLLNSIYRCGDEVLVDEVADLYPDTPDPAAAAVADTLGVILGLSVDHYAMVDMVGFVEVVDAFGGLELDLRPPRGTQRDAPREGCDWRAFDVQPGSSSLDGRAALELVRNRDDTNEADRMARQRCLLVTLADQVDDATVLRQFGQLAGVLRRNVVTSIPLNEAPALLELAREIDADATTTVGFGQPDYMLDDDSPDLDRIREDVEATLERSSRTAMPSAGG